MEKIYDVTALGELLIDFTENGTSEQGNPLLEANPGGAPCNVLAMLEKLGKKTAFIGKVGKDMFGEQLKTAVEEVGIDTRNLVMDEEVHTTLAFVHTYPDGDRDFSFYRNPGADMMLKKEEVDEDLIRGAKIFHFGTLSSTHEGVREATRYAIDVAKEAGCIVSFDPNLRPPLWKSLDEAKAEIEYGLSKCDILKISDNEVEFLFGTTDYDEGARLIREKYQIPLVLITLGKDGSRAYYKDLRVEVPGFVQEHTIETTGAGDTFCANSLNYILEHGMEELTEENLKELLTFANAAASLITTHKGAQGSPARFTYNGYAGMKKVFSKYPMMNGSKFAEMRKLAGKFENSVDESDDVDTDWQDLMLRDGYVNSHDVSVSGGTNGGGYSFGAAYYKDQGVIPTQNYTRYSLRGSFDQGVGKYFRFGLWS